MKWYVAHIILYTRFKDGVQDDYPVWENMILIEAESREEARDKAVRNGQFQAAKNDDYTCDGRPAEWVFAGIRKVHECLEFQNPEERLEGGSEEDGSEVTYSALKVDSEESLRQLVSNEDVTVVYEGSAEQG